jgi:integrase/recombinase XerC/integrase/recombinase XerD
LAMRGETPGALFVSLSRRNWGDRLGRSAIRKMAKRRYREAGIVGERKSTHSLRHSAISNVIRHGASPLQAQAMARHKSFNTTLGYYHEIARTENPAEDLVDYSNGNGNGNGKPLHETTNGAGNA